MNHENKEKETTTNSTCERQPSAVGVPATYLSLCSGYDGIGIALQRIYGGALRTLAHVEIESFAIANLVAKMEAGQLDSCPVFTDVKRFPFEDLRGRVGIMSAGFPCQPFSSAGKRQATEDPRHIYPYIADGISVCRPAYVLLENVEGIISSKTADGESVLKYVLGDLEERGYTCSWGTFSAAEVIGGDGRRIPHLRKRVFILAKLADCNGEGLEGRQRGSLQERTRQLSLGESGTQALYPARPNERQHWWEEPRVVCDASSKGLEGSGGKSVQGGDVGLTCADGEEDGELADTKSGKPRKSKGRDRRKDTGGGSEEELEDSESGEPKFDSMQGRQEGTERGKHSISVGLSSGSGSEEVGQLGDASTEGLQGELRQSRKSEESDSKTQGEGSEQTSSVKRPVDVAAGEVVGDASSERSRGGSADGADVESEVPRKGSESYVQADLPETESELGGTTDAWGGLRGVDPITNRVDRLRLLGNGVCVDTCVLAFTTLYNRLNQGEPTNE